MWATAATALHNIPQQEFLPEEHAKYFHDMRSEKEKEEQKKKKDKNKHASDHRLAIGEDPLAYLGILVDILQEWDRYCVQKDTILQGKHSLQASDVDIGSDGKKVKIRFPEKVQADAVKKTLRKCLYNWKAIVDIDYKERSDR